MKKIATLLTIFAILLTSIVWAKRVEPAKVVPITSGQIEYRAPHKQMGCVEAWDTKRKGIIWRRQIYVVKYSLSLERDVQDVYITKTELKGNNLIVKNERESEYVLNLDTLVVKVLKGSLIEKTN